MSYNHPAESVLAVWAQLCEITDPEPEKFLGKSPVPMPHPSHLDNNIICKPCRWSTLPETLPSLISRRTMVCGSCIPLSKTAQVLGREADPVLSQTRLG